MSRPYVQNCRMQEDDLSIRSRKFGIPYLAKDTNYTCYYRISNYEQFIDVWQEGNICKGFVTSFTHKFVDAKERYMQRGDIVFTKDTLPAEFAEELICRLQKLDSINNKHHRITFKPTRYFDRFDIEYTSKTIFTERNFNPCYQCSDTLPVIPNLEKLLAFMNTGSEIREMYTQFMSCLPEGIYNDGDFKIIVDTDGKHKLKRL